MDKEDRILLLEARIKNMEDDLVILRKELFYLLGGYDERSRADSTSQENKKSCESTSKKNKKN